MGAEKGKCGWKGRFNRCVVPRHRHGNRKGSMGKWSVAMSNKAPPGNRIGFTRNKKGSKKQIQPRRPKSEG
jgi:hypothetical protein